MTELFLKIVNMNLTASYCIIIVCLARLALKRAPKIYSYALWLIVAFRLICPVSFESGFSLFKADRSGIQHNQAYTIQQPLGIFINRTALPAASPPIDSVPGSNTLFTSAEQTSAPQMIFFTAAVVWAVGIVALLTYSLITYFKMNRKLLKSSFPLEAYPYSQKRARKIKVWKTKGLDTPIVFGIFRPQIYLPYGLTQLEKACCLEHEVTHIRRKDPFIKQCAFLLTCIHWFNPFVWLAFREMSRDMEMSCDETVIRGTGIDNANKKLYSTTLLSLASGQHYYRGNPLAFGENNIKRRIRNIMNYKKPGFWISIVSVIAVVALGAGLIADPRSAVSKAEGSEEVIGTAESNAASEVIGSSEIQSPAVQKTVNTLDIGNEADVTSTADTTKNLRLQSSDQYKLSAVITADTLRVRNLPSDNAEVIGLLKKGEPVEVIALAASLWNAELPKQFTKAENYEESQEYAEILFPQEDAQVHAYVQAKYLNIDQNSNPDPAARFYWAAKIWGDAFCGRNGSTLMDMTKDKNKFSDWSLAEVLPSGIITFGYSSPWPWTSYSMEFSEAASTSLSRTEWELSSTYDVKFYYYAQTSEPSITVWTQSIRFSPELWDKARLDEFYKDVVADFTDITIYDEILSGEQFDEAYLTQNNGLQFYNFDLNGETQAIAYQLTHTTDNNGLYGGVLDNSVYNQPDTAAVKYLHLSGGRAETVEEGDNTALIRYTFQDGTTRDIPMHIAVTDPVVWSVGEAKLK